jgi:hypothetical protein
MQKQMIRTCILLICLILGIGKSFAQVNPDKVFDTTIHTVLVAPVGRPLDAPILFLNTREQLQISFDDFKAQYQDYYYTIELVDSAWKSIEMNDFEYVNGFNQNKITNYSVSSIAAQKYFHYQFNFPNNNSSPKLSGNYILKVYVDNNKDKLVFTQRFFVVENLTEINAVVQAPFDGAITRSHQKIKLSIDIKNVPNFQNDQLKVSVIQNNRYNDCRKVSIPNFIRGNILEFNNEEELLFPGGNEYRWLDLQSLSLRSDRVAAIENNSKLSTIIVKPDFSRTDILYNSFRDLNGGYLIINTESLQSESQNDYATVLFSYVTKDRKPLLDKKVYLVGAITNNVLDKNAEMQFDVRQGVYTKKLLLKQGYYSYAYILRDREAPNFMDDFVETEGSYTETENNYSVLVYYHAPGTRNDQIIGFSNVSTKQN